MLFDTHAHLDFDDFRDDLDEVVARAEELGMKGVINPGCDLSTSLRAVEISEEYGMIHAAVGVHPNEVWKAKPGDFLEISRLAEHPNVVAIGEIGLDFYRDRTPRDQQVRAFSGQLECARELDLPVIIHFRDVGIEGIEMVGESAFDGIRCVFHCFGGTVEFAKMLVEKGFYIGFDGPLTFRNSDRVDVAREVPVERCLIETDAPFLTPHPYRGKRNEPARVIEVAKKLAEVKGIDLDTVVETTGRNACALFRLAECRQA